MLQLWPTAAGEGSHLRTDQRRARCREGTWEAARTVPGGLREIQTRRQGARHPNGDFNYGRLAQLVRVPALQALSPLLFSPSVTFNSLLYQQLGEPARRSRANPIPSTNRGFDTVLIHVRSRCSVVTGPVSALAEPIPYLDQCGIAQSQAAWADRPRSKAQHLFMCTELIAVLLATDGVVGLPSS